MPASSGWDDRADEWIAWTRAPRHDSYAWYSPSFFDAVVPKAGRRTLELGCGEGRVVRDLHALGHNVIGVDLSPALLRSAQQADPGGRYVLADAGNLPFADAAFDVIVAYNSLMDVDDMPAAVHESARVLGPGGRLCACVTHPVNDAGSFDEREPEAIFKIEDAYLDPRRPFEQTLTRDGLTMKFDGFAYPLESYARALEDAGLLIELIREPPASAQAVDADPGYARWRRIPLFLHLRAIKPTGKVTRVRTVRSRP